MRTPTEQSAPREGRLSGPSPGGTTSVQKM
jgi:hypothetical protein